MKALSMKIAAGMMVLGAFLYFSACSPPTPTNNASQNIATNQNTANVMKAAPDLRACDDHGAGHGAHAKGIKDEIEAKMGTSLKKLLKRPDNPNGTFTVEVQKAEGDRKYYIAYIKGKISGDDNLKELSDILNDFQSKQDCLRIVYFNAVQKMGSTTDDGPGFEWSACEYPLVVCPNGECCHATGTDVNPGGTTESLTNANANANANAKKGGNANY